MKVVTVLQLFITCMITMQSATHGQQEAVDRTLQPGAQGRAVVRAVLSKLDASQAFSSDSASTDDTNLVNIFMRRLAFVETEDGNMSNPMGGGIWNVPLSTFTQTLGYTGHNFRYVYGNISTYFMINWTSDEVHYDNLTKPMYSGIAIRLYIHNLVNNDRLSIPGRIGQALYWVNNFQPAEQTNTWNQAVNRLEMMEVCTVDTDLVFVLDSSGSISEDNFELVKDFTHNFTKSLIQDSDNDRVGVITYSNEGRVEIELNSELNKNKEKLLETIQNITPIRGYTNTPDGICKMISQAWRRGLVLRLAVVLTDGRSNRRSPQCGDLEEATTRAKAIVPPVLVYAIGVGNRINQGELVSIASRQEFVDHVNSFDIGLRNVLEERSYQICFDVMMPIPVGTSNDGNANRRDINHLSFTAPVEAGITVRLCIREGRVVLYASTSVRNPNSALHEWSAEVMSTEQSVNCLTEYFDLGTGIANAGRKRRSETDSRVLYYSVEGVADNSEYFVNSSYGNVTLDVNECEAEPYPCAANASCFNTDGSFYCVCFAGFSGNGSECQDLDECEQDINSCNRNEECINIVGDYYCKRIKENSSVIITATVMSISVLLLTLGLTIVVISLCFKKHGGSKKKPSQDCDSDDSDLNLSMFEKPDDDDEQLDFTMTVTWQQNDDREPIL